MESVSVLFIGDIIGKPGLSFVQTWLPALKKEYKPDIIIANGENVNDGKGIVKTEGEALFQLGVDVITGGNHIWDKHQSQDYLKNESKVLRPLNYPKGTHGNGIYLLEKEGVKLGVVNLQGRSFMATIDCPFRAADFAISKLKTETNMIFVDFHAEATAEKIALGWYLDGKVSAIVGTHTHVQTADERILPNGTGYITDAGMTGPYESVIGMKSQAAINRFIYQTPQKYETAQNDIHLSGVLFQITKETGKCTSVKRVFFPEFA
ncbi:MAG: TIGR00282 family metallophosphoesterase [Ignavibacteriaceae bacterium]|nr:TIGR00282 family metallophosphoesterase [Ignavibacteriaceae bacterium]